MNSRQQTLRNISRDHRRHVEEIDTIVQRHQVIADLSLIGAYGIAKRFPDVVSPYELSMAVVRALDDDGIIFARMDTDVKTDDEEPTFDERGNSDS